MDPKHFLDNLSTHLKSVIARAIAIAGTEGLATVSPTHLLLSMVQERGSVGADLLGKAGANVTAIEATLPTRRQSSPLPTSAMTKMLPPLNEMAKKSLEKAMLVAYEREHTYVGTEHLLFGLIHTEDETLERAFGTLAMNHDQIEDQLDLIFDSSSRLPDMEQLPDVMAHIEDTMAQEREHDHEAAEKPPAGKDTPMSKRPQRRQVAAIDLFTVNLTGKEAQARIDPVIGREDEIERIIHILCRRTKNNPVLIGEPGVGKTAIVEGLAKKIVEGDVPDILKRKKILSLDLPLLLAGTMYRGEFEARLKQIIEEVSQDQSIILFIDELHNLIGAGGGNGAMDAANMLKPALARGILRCIGATTTDEYAKYIEHDPALERRFQSVEIREPSHDDTRHILRGIRPYYEDYHHVRITDDALDAAVTLSARYVHDHYLPDKAIDLIDEASAVMRAKRTESPAEEKVYALEQEVDALKEEKEAAILNEDFSKAEAVKKKADALSKKIAAFRGEVAGMKKPARKKVTETDIASVLGRRLRLDPAFLLEDEWKQLGTLGPRLKEHIVGQDQVIERIVSHVRRSLLEPKTVARPLASLLFAGPSGVGKTALGKALAKELYHDERALIRFDMSEFAEGHSVSRLLGSPAGYVGYQERNRFTDEIKKRPYSVVLFDEFDKAHPDVRRLLLQILDEGELTDSHGKKIPFRHAVVILTTNVGAEAFKSSGIGFGSADTDAARTLLSANERIKDELGAAILGRVGHVAVFSPLQKQHLIDIMRRRLERLSADFVALKRPKIDADTQALEKLAHEQWNPDQGARHIERALDDVIYHLLDTQSSTRKKKQYRLTADTETYLLR